jgi:hypothetical protein
VKKIVAEPVPPPPPEAARVIVRKGEKDKEGDMK